MGNLTCKKCKYHPENDSKIDYHHIVPKEVGGTDKDGRIPLCGENKGNDCHRKIHILLRKFKEALRGCKEAYKDFTKIWLVKKDVEYKKITGK